MSSSTAALHPLCVSAMQLLSAARTGHDGGDYRWLVGLEMFMAIFQLGISFPAIDRDELAAFQEQARALKAEREAEWKEYAHLVKAPDFFKFCGLPGVHRHDIKPTVGVLLRNGIPYGAIHCEVNPYA